MHVGVQKFRRKGTFRAFREEHRIDE
jgi:hypothetical protein